MLNNIFSGIFTALITPLKEGNIDFVSLEKLIEHQIKGKVDGIIIGGSTGEGMNLSFEEYKSLLKSAIKISNKRLAVIGACASTSTAFACEMAKFNNSEGADGIMVTVPPYVKPSQEGIYQHFKVIHDAVDLPIMLYTIFSRTGVDIADETLVKLSKLNNILGMKDSCGNLARPIRILSQIKKEFSILAGDDELALAFYAQGAKGCVSVASNILPKSCKDIQLLWKQGESEKALIMQNKLLPIYHALFIEPNPTVIKYACSMFNLCNNELRLPLLPCTQNTQENINKVLEMLDVRI